MAEPIGEAWLTGVEVHDRESGISPGKHWAKRGTRCLLSWRGERFAPSEQFPLLVKFIFPADKLSIQVHPDDAYAAAHEKAAGGRGKTEMWHVVSAEPGATLLAGLIRGSDQGVVRCGDCETERLSHYFSRMRCAPATLSFCLPALRTPLDQT